MLQIFVMLLQGMKAPASVCLSRRLHAVSNEIRRLFLLPLPLLRLLLQTLCILHNPPSHSATLVAPGPLVENPVLHLLQVGIGSVLLPPVL
jgi:hypothetical protein